MAAREGWRARRRQSLAFDHRAVLATGLGTALFLVLSMAGLWVFYRLDSSDGSFSLPRPFPPPALQSDTAGELKRYIAAQRAELTGYAWVDRERGVARLPVARAMELIVARGGAAFAPLVPPEPVSAARR